MKYTKEQSVWTSAVEYMMARSLNTKRREQYDISYQTARDYMRLYRNVNHLLPKRGRIATGGAHIRQAVSEPNNLEEYESMSKEELIQELVKARV